MKEIIFYTSKTGDVKINVTLKNETLWLFQKMIAELFGVQQPAIAKHLKNIYEEGELIESLTYSKMEGVQKEGNREVKRKIDFYNLDAIIAVGYRVNSKKATQFRIWATNVLTEFIKKGFVMDDERLKNGEKFGKDYFEELLERIRDIYYIKMTLINC